MKYFKIITISFIAVLLSGCSQMMADYEARERQEATLKTLADQPVRCNNKSECDLMWQRAQFFVQKHSHLKIQTANDVVIQTYGSTSSRKAAFKVSKEPLANEGANIFVVVWCREPSCDFGYGRTWEYEMALKAQRYIFSGE